ncbi:MAG TPA: hypothetical protein VL463_16075 [Kofleriaceae bacterium]|nr:hypothetical protein [Kofleriaceae bacterium]
MISILTGTLAGGCMMAGNYHSAKTLNKGESQFGLTFSGTQYEKTSTDSMGNVSRDAIVLPNIIPEITYHVGMAENVEVGGRVSIGALGMEGDVKYRFLHNDKLHMAIAPALGAQAFVLIQGVYVRLPVILTYELADNVDFTVAVFGASEKFSPASSDSSDAGEFNGTFVSSGGAVGFDLHGETFSIRPAVEFTRYLYNFSDGSGNSASDGFNTVNFLVHLAWTGGKEKQQLDRIENKLDEMNRNNNTSPYPNYPPGPPSGPPPSGPDAPPPPPPAPPQ